MQEGVVATPEIIESRWHAHCALCTRRNRGLDGGVNRKRSFSFVGDGSALKAPTTPLRLLFPGRIGNRPKQKNLSRGREQRKEGARGKEVDKTT